MEFCIKSYPLIPHVASEQIYGESKRISLFVVTKISPKADKTTRSLLRENETVEILARNWHNIEQNPKVPGTREPDYFVEG